MTGSPRRFEKEVGCDERRRDEEHRYTSTSESGGTREKKRTMTRNPPLCAVRIVVDCSRLGCIGREDKNKMDEGLRQEGRIVGKRW